jgi:hypothetical protein
MISVQVIQCNDIGVGYIYKSNIQHSIIAYHLNIQGLELLEEMVEMIGGFKLCTVE